MTDLSTWLINVATILVGELPLQSRDDAMILVEAYLSDIGGWVPDDQGHPYGNGHPANSFTEQQTADAITTNEFNAVYDLNLTVSVVLNLQYAVKLTDGVTLNDASTSIINQITDYLTASINDSNLPFRVDSVGTQTAISGNSNYGVYNSETGESTTQSIRQIIVGEITGDDKIVDFKASTLKYVKDTYGLDDTWNVVSVFTTINEPITVQIRKYVDDTFAALDNGSDLIYVITISPVTHAIVSGVILNR